MTTILPQQSTVPPPVALHNVKMRTWERRILEAKRKHRPKLTEAHLRGGRGWEKDRYAFKAEDGGREEDFEKLKILPPCTKGL